MSTAQIQWIGIAAGVLTAISMLPQVIKTFREKKAEHLSLVMIIVLMGGIACWIWYGYLRSDLPVMVTNGFSFAVNILLLACRLKYGNRK